MVQTGIWTNAVTVNLVDFLILVKDNIVLPIVVTDAHIPGPGPDPPLPVATDRHLPTSTKIGNPEETTTMTVGAIDIAGVRAHSLPPAEIIAMGHPAQVCQMIVRVPLRMMRRNEQHVLLP